MERKDSGRQFSLAMKIAAVERMPVGANVSELAREIGISRKGLYVWKKRFDHGGALALRSAGRPRREVPTPSDPPDELSRAFGPNRRVGQQTVGLDFFSKPCSASREWSGYDEGPLDHRR